MTDISCKEIPGIRALYQPLINHGIGHLDKANNNPGSPRTVIRVSGSLQWTLFR